MKIDDVLIIGEKYKGELLIVDYGLDVKEDSWYVVLNNGEVKEVI